MIKRISSVLIVLSLVFSSLTVFAKPDDNLFENYSYDFSLGQTYWELNQTYVGAKALHMQNGWCAATLPKDLTWKNCVLEFDYTLEDYDEKLGSAWFMFAVKGVSTMLRYSNGQTYVYYLGTEVAQEPFSMRIGNTYHFRVEAYGKSYKTYVSGEEIAREKLICKIDNNPNESGLINFVGYFKSTIDNVKVSCFNEDLYVAKEKVKNLSTAEKAKFEFNKKGNLALTYESSDNNVAEVDGDGNITAVDPGFAIIRAKDAAGKEIENMGVYVYTTLESGAFEDADRTEFYVGDTIDVHFVRNPSNALISTEWTIDDSEKADLYGSTDLRRAVTFKKSGKCCLTVKDVLSGYEKQIEFDVREDVPQSETHDTIFYLTGGKSLISDGLVGYHCDAKISDMTDEDFAAIDKINPGSFRVAYNMINDFMSKNNEQQGESFETYLDNTCPVWNWVNKTSARELIVNANIAVSKPDEFVDQMKYIKSKMNDDKQLTIELDNEIYAIQFKNVAPTVKEYLEWALSIADAVHAWDSSVKVVLCAMGGDGETNILSDPNNLELMLKDDWAYTQGDRIAEWNATIAKYADRFDGVTCHDYFNVESGANLSEEDFIKIGYAWNEGVKKSNINISERYNNKKIWMTEWTSFAPIMFWGRDMNEADKIRYQWQMYPYFAMRNFEQLFGMLESDTVASANMHFLRDGQGFGTFTGGYQAEGVKLPNFYLMQKFGELVKNNTTYYDLNAPDDRYTVVPRPLYHGHDRNVLLHDVKAWGLGDENTMKTFVVSNHTDVPQRVSLKNAKIRPVWQMGGDVRKLMPDWMRNSKYTSWLYNSGVVTDIGAKEFNGTQYSDECEVPPYSMTILEVSGEPEQLSDTTVGKISKYAKEVLQNALCLKVNNSKAYRDNISVKIDDDESVVPTIKNGRTLLPLRFVAESFGCDVDYDDTTGHITITDKNNAVELTVGKKEYTVNGEAKSFDVEAEVQSGRTLVPLRALTEALGKEVFWDDRGIIAIYEPKTGFTSEQKWFDATLKPDIDSLLNLFE